ncbi:MAG: hypothetical protein GX492_13000 [Firmicutes bacterium]|nr:hypothetical protein [Bacillota bacterium]
MPRFYSEPIDVIFHSRPGPPAAFVWRGQEHRIASVEAAWQDHGIGTVSPKHANWRLRRHRNYYRVRTDDGRVFEFYLDRGGGRRRWVLYREL